MRTFVHAVAFAASALALLLVGCGGSHGVSGVTPVRAQGRVPFVTKLTPIEFTFPAGWHLNQNKHPFDLQCYSPGDVVNTAVFTYKKVDLELEATPLSVFWEQINDLKSKRTDFKEASPLQKQEDEAKTVTSIEYSGKKDSAPNYYRFSLIEFKSDASRFAFALQVATPEDREKYKSIFEEIIRSARLLPEVP